MGGTILSSIPGLSPWDAAIPHPSWDNEKYLQALPASCLLLGKLTPVPTP